MKPTAFAQDRFSTAQPLVSPVSVNLLSRSALAEVSWSSFLVMYFIGRLSGLWLRPKHFSSSLRLAEN